MTMAREGWFAAQGIISWGVIWPYAVEHWGTPQVSVWWFAGITFAFGCICTGIRKFLES